MCRESIVVNVMPQIRSVHYLNNFKSVKNTGLSINVPSSLMLQRIKFLITHKINKEKDICAVNDLILSPLKK